LFRTKGHVPTCYSPVCRSPCGALDLHVLGLPPAFALSQDQTLKLDENFFPADHVSHGDASTHPDGCESASPFDEVPLLYMRAQASSAIARAPTCRLHDNRVDLKRRPPKSLPGRTLAKKPKPCRFSLPGSRIAARKDSAVHVSLSSDSLVKQPGTARFHPPASRRAAEASRFRSEIGSLVTEYQ
jgi:hypothetical protein